MKVILSPAKKMKLDTDSLEHTTEALYLKEAEVILEQLRAYSVEELKTLYKCNEKIAEQNFERLKNMDLHKAVSPALFSYEGIAYQYIAPTVLSAKELEYVSEHLCILSALYGVLRATDRLSPYRLEMQAGLSIGEYSNLYEFWGDKIYRACIEESRTIINLASKEYSSCVEKYIQDKDRYITCNFVEESAGKLITKATYAKMARGYMLKFMAERDIREPEGLKEFDAMAYRFREDLSSDTSYVFERSINVEQDRESKEALI